MGKLRIQGKTNLDLHLHLLVIDVIQARVFPIHHRFWPAPCHQLRVHVCTCMYMYVYGMYHVIMI